MKDFDGINDIIEKPTDICIGKVMVMSGVRPCGRSVNYTDTGRKRHGILYIFSGEARFFENGKSKVTVSSGDLLYIPKDCKYKMQYSATSTVFVLLDIVSITSDGVEKPLCDSITIMAKDDKERRIASIMSELEICSFTRSIEAAMHTKELIYRLLRTVFENTKLLSVSEKKDMQIFAGASMLQSTYLENIPITQFARASNMSISSFRDTFTKKYGISPIQYRNRLRIERAAAILKEGSCTVAEAAYASGFENIGYFCRYYKKITGETPSQTRSRSLK